MPPLHDWQNQSAYIYIYITATKFSVAVNGSLVGYFSGKKHLRQSDPMPYYLFVIAMGVLSTLLNKAAMEDAFHYHPKCKKISLTHLCFGR